MNRAISSCVPGLWTSIPYPCHRRLRSAVSSRGFAVCSPWSTFSNLDLTSHQVIQVGNSRLTNSVLPLKLDRIPPSGVRIIPTPASMYLREASTAPTHLFFGGLPALMQAVRRLEKLEELGDYTTTVTLVNDGKMPKTRLSGHQAHNHPSEWPSPECQITPLFKTFLRGVHLLPEDNPFDMEQYSYLHFPVDWARLFNTPRAYLGIYASFFGQRIIHDLTAKNGVSKQDHWLCDNIEQSLSYHETLSSRIEKSLGTPSFKRDFRVYWSPNKAGMQKKQKTWTNLNIPTQWMSKEEILKRTLLRVDRDLHVLKVIGDGKFFPSTPELIVRYLQHRYSSQFIYHPCTTVEEIFVDVISGQSLVAYMKNLDTEKGILAKAISIFGSPGHSEVYRYGVSQKIWERAWEEVPVAGITSLWKCTISKQELQERFGKSSAMTDAQLRKKVEDMVAAANLCNLHVTSWDCVIEGDKVVLFVRASQGANFNMEVASKQDLINMRNNIDAYFIGEWELESAGSCVRKTKKSNVPEIYRLSSTVAFGHGYSGLGYSYSAAPWESLEHPR